MALFYNANAEKLSFIFYFLRKKLIKQLHTGDKNKKTFHLIRLASFFVSKLLQVKNFENNYFGHNNVSTACFISATNN